MKIMQDRKYFAGQALIGLLARPGMIDGHTLETSRDFAKAAKRLAREMMKSEGWR